MALFQLPSSDSSSEHHHDYLLRLQNVIMDLLHPDPMQRIHMATMHNSKNNHGEQDKQNVDSTIITTDMACKESDCSSRQLPPPEDVHNHTSLDLYPRLVHALSNGSSIRIIKSNNNPNENREENRTTFMDDSHPLPRFVPDPPAWWKQRDQTLLKDGAQGWSVFLC
jgi:hypothetical protein